MAAAPPRSQKARRSRAEAQERRARSERLLGLFAWHRDAPLVARSLGLSLDDLHAELDDLKLRRKAYRLVRGSDPEMPLVKAVKTDGSGRFDFGDLQEGHYTLVIDWPSESAGWFDVEIKKLPRPTTSVKIDVSPVYPDCTGGHEFISF